MKPLIIYVDDEPHNLTVFEAGMSTDEWEVRTFQTPLAALDALDQLEPHVIVSDQRMPGFSGVRFLELARKLRPNAIRIIVTGYSDEDLVIESVRKAQVFDYIRKPWEPVDLEAALRRAIEVFRTSEQARTLHAQLVASEALLKAQNARLEDQGRELADTLQRERNLRTELEAWAPPFILEGNPERPLSFPVARDIVGITYDIIGSSDLHDAYIEGHRLRSLVLRRFSELLLAQGGWRESHAGDSAYGHFGLWRHVAHPADAALACAREFRSSLRTLTALSGVEVECGLALHVARNSIVDVHTVNVALASRTVTQKSFDTSSIDIDLLHRMEKLCHRLPGTNIIMSEDFRRMLRVADSKIRPLGNFLLRGQKAPIQLHIITSDRVREEHLLELLRDAASQAELVVDQVLGAA